MRILLVLSLSFLLSSCASYFVRQQCEKTNWFQYGQEVALRGERLSSDDFVNQCRKAEAEMSESQLDQGFKSGMGKYCQPDTAYQVGKTGDSFNTDFCESNIIGSVKKRHAEGLTAYCKDGNSAGLSGKKYKNVCPADLEKNFLPAYRSGRKKYLGALVQNNEGKLRELNLEVDRLTYEKRISDGRMAVLPYVKPGDQDPYDAERRRLQDRTWQLNNELSQKSSQKNKLQSETDDYKKEIATLD